MSRRLLFAIVAVFLVSVDALAGGTVADGLRAGLSKATNASDSLKILFDVYDSSPQKDKDAVGWQILDVASRINEQDVLLEFLPQMTMLNLKNDEKMRDLLVLAEKIRV